MIYKRLCDCADYRNERTAQIDYETYITTDNMIPNRGGISTVESLPDTKAVCKYLEGDILLSNIRPYFKKIWLANRKGGCSNDVLVVTAKEPFSPEFLYYVLSDTNFFNYDTATSKGTKMPRGTPKAIMKYLVPDYGIEKQSSIVSVLSAYDNLIEVNNKRIKALEQMAENLYKEWFVRFRFPGYESVLFENDLPYGWRIQRLEEVSDFVYGKMPEKQFVSDTGYPIFSGYQISGYYKEYSFAETMLVLIARGVGGTGEVRMAPAFSYITNLSIIFRLKNPELYKMYLYYLFSLKNLRYLDTGAAQSQITIDNLKRVRVVIPANNVLLAFNKQISKIMELIEKIKEQNALLNKQRDLLLPRLMSGKMEV